jgi:hypothetical protein|uniref:Uncharacterized protein n=1 Tax=Zea mays TaxID=4577 RepID=C4J0E6_MAIZE|nr:unknown [Zea mays]
MYIIVLDLVPSRMATNPNPTQHMHFCSTCLLNICERKPGINGLTLQLARVNKSLIRTFVPFLGTNKVDIFTQGNYQSM